MRANFIAAKTCPCCDRHPTLFARVIDLEHPRPLLARARAMYLRSPQNFSCVRRLLPMFRLRISDLGLRIENPGLGFYQSAFRNPQSEISSVRRATYSCK